MEIYNYDCIVIGSGAAGLSAACRLRQSGVNIAIITEGINCGTSRNTGSDKQTYYKLGLSGDSPDSVRRMAQDLFDGGCADGDNALCEAALSARCFLNMCELGVPFPQNRYGEYVGYKTDHDPYARATSAGPLTSKYMTEALQKKAKELGIPVFDGCYAAKILKYNDRVCGVLCVRDGKTVSFRAPDIVMATGGPAGIYADSVYPECHTGSSGLAIEAGVKMQNLSFWQYGLASVSPRWNVSGTYMQVLPRFVSVDKSDKEHDFLKEHFADESELLSLVFLKGYQWPYNIKNRSSEIDMLVFAECQKGRRVYLDFTKNPYDIDYKKLIPEAYDYLNKADAAFGTPIERLLKMNAPAVELYRCKGVDLTNEYLEIALCAQHNNGGIAVDMWWQSSVRGLFAVGECAGTHGISRPGGSALNSGQVGALRASQYIAAHPNTPISDSEFLSLLTDINIFFDGDALQNARKRMSECAGAIRDKEKISAALKITLKELERADFKLKETLLTQAAVMTSILRENTDPTKVQELIYRDGKFTVTLRDIRPIPQCNDFFENVWRGYRQNKNIY